MEEVLEEILSDEEAASEIAVVLKSININSLMPLQKIFYICRKFIQFTRSIEAVAQ